MVEPLFGSSSTFWPSLQGPAIGHSPGSFALARPLVGLGPTLGPSVGPAAFTGAPIGAPTLIPPAPSPPESYAFASPLLSAMPSLPIVSQDASMGLTPHAILAAVALRRGQPLGPTNDQEIEDFIYDALDVLPGASDVEVRCEAGRATLTGTVPHKRLKRDAGELAWAIPSLNDVQNNITIAARRRARSQSREAEAGQAPGRKAT